jgi:enoyl-CoA hydratase/carnithine racemase
VTAFAPWREYETIVAEHAGGVLRLTLNRPERLNAFVPQMARELAIALAECGADPDLRAVLLRGSGAGFSSGGDLRERVDLPVEVVMREYYSALILAVRALPKPVVAAVHGPAVGVGCSLALACDVVVMARSAYLSLPFVEVGLVPDGGASLLAARRAGGGHAMGMALLTGKLGAERAGAIGLANEVVDDDALEERAEEIARRFATGPAVALAGTKELLNRAVFAGLAEELDREAALQGQASRSEDFAEAVAAFAERRKPEFAGR